MSELTDVERESIRQIREAFEAFQRKEMTREETLERIRRIVEEDDARRARKPV
jgi:hypothetical protein